MDLKKKHRDLIRPKEPAEHVSHITIFLEFELGFFSTLKKRLRVQN